MKDVAVHIGLHKTGTTFLQNDIFPTLPGVATLRRWHSIRSIMDSSTEKVVLISDEDISGHPFRGKWMDEFEENLSFVKRFFNKPAIIVGFRQHDSFVLSLYKQYLQIGGTEGIEYVFDPRRDSGLIKTYELSFATRIQFLEKHFDRIFIYTQEELRDDLDMFVHRLSTFLGVPAQTLDAGTITTHNKGLKGYRQVQLLLRLNQLNKHLEQKGLPTLNNKLFTKLRMTPRALCQERLSFLPSRSLTLPEYMKTFLQSEFAEDWQYIKHATSPAVTSFP